MIAWFAIPLLLAPVSPESPLGSQGDSALERGVALCVQKLNDADPDVRRAGVRRLKQMGPEAIPHLRTIIRTRGRTLARRQDVLDALEDLEMGWAESEIRSLFPEDGGIGSFDGMCLPVIEALGDRAEPLLLALALSPIREHRVRIIAAQGLGELGRRSAIGGLRKVAGDPAELTRVRDAAALAMDRLGDPSIVDRMLVEILPEVEQKRDLEAILRLAAIYERRNQFEKVVGLYEQAKQIDSRQPTFDYNLACAYARMGRKEEALDALEQTIRKGYPDREWIEKDGDLDAIRSLPRFREIVSKLKKR